MKQNLFGLFLLLLLVREVSAQKPADFNVTHYTNENGLPQNSIKGVELDKNGFLWIATESGLLRFDGQQFKLYDRNHCPGMSSNRLVFIGLTKDGIIFFIDSNRKYYSFNRYGALTLSEYYTAIRGPDPDNPAIKIDFNKTEGEDEGFVTGEGVEVIYIAGKKKLWTRNLPDVNYNTFRSKGYLNKKLYYLNKQFKIKSVDRNGIVKEVVLKGVHQNLKAAALYPNNYGFFKQAEALYFLLDKHIYQLRQSGEQELTADLVLESDVPDICTYRNYPFLNLQIVGSATHGLYLYRKKQFKALRHTNGSGNFYPQVVYRDSGVITTGGLVYPSSLRFNYPFVITSEWRSLLRDKRGHYWINIPVSTWEKGISYIAELDEQLRIVKKYRTLFTYCLRETPDGNIWGLQFNGYQIGKISGDSIKWLPNLWTERPVNTFLPENNDELWIGGVRTFAKLNVRTGKEQHYKSLEQFTIETLYLDADKVLWIGTTGDGFFALKQNKVYRLPLDIKNGLSNVHAFIEDKRGFMWMSTNNGLFRCKKQDLTSFIDHKATTVYYQCFNKDAGFNTNEFNGSCTPSAVVLGNGKFSFPSIDGLVQFHPDSIREVLPETKIFIEKLFVDGKKQDLSKYPALEPSFKHLEIEVVSPFFGNPVNQQIEYNVKGSDRNWYPVRNDNIVTLNNLPYGKYSLQFRKRAGFGSNNMITTVLPFTVKPFFYQTWYFRLAVLALAVIVIFTGVRIRYANLVKRNRQLELEVTQRTLHLKNANKLKEKLLLMVGHDLRSPLHFLGILALDVRHSVANGEQDKISSAAEEIHDTTRKLHAFVEEFSLWARLQDEQYNLRKRNFPISGLLEELSLFFEETLQAHNNTLELPADQDREIYTNHELLKAILRNLVDNANKHTRKGHIRISWLEDKNTGWQLCVSDTGNGMSSSELNNIRRRIAHFQEPTAIKPGSQLGYQLIIDFATRLDLALHIDSEKGIGTTVTISGIQVHHHSGEQPGLFPAETVDRSKLH